MCQFWPTMKLDFLERTYAHVWVLCVDLANLNTFLEYSTVKTLIRAAALIKFQAIIGGSYSSEAVN